MSLTIVIGGWGQCGKPRTHVGSGPGRGAVGIDAQQRLPAARSDNGAAMPMPVSTLQAVGTEQAPEFVEPQADLAEHRLGRRVVVAQTGPRPNRAGESTRSMSRLRRPS